MTEIAALKNMDQKLVEMIMNEVNIELIESFTF